MLKLVVIAFAVFACPVTTLAGDWTMADHKASVAAGLAVAASYDVNERPEALAALARSIASAGDSLGAREILHSAANLLSGSDTSNPAVPPHARGEIVEGFAFAGDAAAAKQLIPDGAPPPIRMLLFGYLGAGAAYADDQEQAKDALHTVVELAALTTLPSYLYNKLSDDSGNGGYDPITAIVFAMVERVNPDTAERLIRELPSTADAKLLSILYAVEHFCVDRSDQIVTAPCQALAQDAEAAAMPAISTTQDPINQTNYAGLAAASVAIVKGVKAGATIVSETTPPEQREQAVQAAASFLAIRGQLYLAQQLLPQSDPYQTQLISDYELGRPHAEQESDQEVAKDDFDARLARARSAGPMTTIPSPIQALLLSTMMFDNPNLKPTDEEYAQALRKASEPQPGPGAYAVEQLAISLAAEGDIDSAWKAERALEEFHGWMFDETRSAALASIAEAEIDAEAFEDALGTVMKIPAAAHRWKPALRLASIPSSP